MGSFGCHDHAVFPGTYAIHQRDYSTVDRVLDRRMEPVMCGRVLTEIASDGLVDLRDPSVAVLVGAVVGCTGPAGGSMTAGEGWP